MATNSSKRQFRDQRHHVLLIAACEHERRTVRTHDVSIDLLGYGAVRKSADDDPTIVWMRSAHTSAPYSYAVRTATWTSSVRRLDAAPPVLNVAGLLVRDAARGSPQLCSRFELAAVVN